MIGRERILRDPTAVAFLAVSAALLAVRVLATSRVGFGDSEALYATYALHPQPAYLDHPGLVGALARAIGGGTSPTPARAHAVTSVMSTLTPAAMAIACRVCGAPWRRAFAAALVFAVVPEIAVGLFAMTPDLLLALFWTAALALAADALRSSPASIRATAGFSLAGVLAGMAAASKVSGLGLLVALAATYGSRLARPHRRTWGPWAGLACGLLVVWPIGAFEARSGWPLLQHRLADTQADARVSLRNLGALVGGQLAYLSPFVAVLAVRAAADLWRARGDAVGRLLLASCLVPAAALVPLCLWSRVAEPHWIAPALLALVPAAARAPRAAPRGLVISALATAGAMVAAAHAWALAPLLRLAPASYEPRLDLANELYGWPEVLGAVREEALASAGAPPNEPGAAVVVGPHWVICAQLAAGLRGDFSVGCDTPIADDFDGWMPRDRWRSAESIVWVGDARFPTTPVLPFYATVRRREVRVDRGGRTVRTFFVAVLERRAQAHASRRPVDLLAIGTRSAQ
jgi:Dolichyl-phosphate-mannose-protein mannosyltransferase